MSEINPECDGAYCLTGYVDVRRYDLGGGSGIHLCYPCWVKENQYRYNRGVETNQPSDWPQQNWFESEPVNPTEGSHGPDPRPAPEPAG